jgi:hypothetical protein
VRAAGVLAFVVSLALVGALAYLLLAGRPEPGSGRAPSGVAATQPSPRATLGPSLPAADAEPDDAGVPSKESERTATAFVDAWLTRDRSQRLARLKLLTVPPLYAGLAYTEPGEIPTAHLVGQPRVQDAGAYSIRYRVRLSDRSEILVSTVYDGTGWLVASVDPVVG